MTPMHTELVVALFAIVFYSLWREAICNSTTQAEYVQLRKENPACQNALHVNLTTQRTQSSVTTNYKGEMGLICAVRLEHARVIEHPMNLPPEIDALFDGVQPENLFGRGGLTQNLARVAIWRPRIFNPGNAQAPLPNRAWCDILREFILVPEVQEFLALD
jgi:hypothetical protein